MSSIRSSHRGREVLIGIAGLVIVGGLIVLIVFFARGGRGFVVATPSMGTTAPVGTLLLTEPTRVNALRVGEIISFHPPTVPSETYSHRIVAITAGAVSTRGDINGATDPWELHDENLVGRAIVVLPGVGWIVRGLPILVIGFLLVFVLTRFVRAAQWRAALRIVGVCLVVSIAAFILRPFTGLEVLQTFVHGNSAGATVVSTGLLPTRVSAAHGTQVDLLDGQVGQLSIPTSLDHGVYRLSSQVHLDFWGWVLFILVCCIPLIATLIVGLPPKLPAGEEAKTA